MRTSMLRAAAAALALGALLVACGDDTVTTTDGPTTTVGTTTTGTVTTGAPTTTAAPTTEAAPSEEEVTATIEAYLEATVSGDFATSKALSDAWAHQWERFLEIDAFVNGTDPSFEAEVAVSLDSVRLSDSGLSIVAEGDVTVTVDGGEGGQDAVISFPQWALVEEGGTLLVADYMVETPDDFGPVVGPLSDLIGYDPVEQEVDGVTVRLGPAVRSAGSGVSNVTFTVYVVNATDATITGSQSAFETEYTLGGDSSIAPLGGVVFPEIAPGDEAWGEVVVNQPDTMVEGEPVSPGVLSFALVDVNDPERIWRFEVATPAFPAQFPL